MSIGIISIGFIINSVLLGVGLAMDAFSVSMANGMHNPGMRRLSRFTIAGTFAFFQFLMPMIGWFCVHEVLQMFQKLEKLIPWVALLLLCRIGGEMLIQGIRGEETEEETVRELTVRTLIVQGIATSIDALSVGFTIADYHLQMAFLAALIIAVVTFFICVLGIRIGRAVGMRLAGKASILGGVILVAIGIEIFISHL